MLGEAQRPAGLLTDRDLALRVLAERRDPLTTRVGDVMTRQLRSVSEGTPIEDALRLMHSLAVRRLPVVDDRERLVGISA